MNAESHSVATLVSGHAEALSLLEAYDRDTSFFFASPNHTLAARGIREVLTTTGAETREALPLRAKALLQESPAPDPAQIPLVGAIPFDGTAAVRLFLPRQVFRAGPLRPAPSTAAAPATQCDLRLLPEPEVYLRGVHEALARIRRHELQKVVLSRALELSFPAPVDLRRLLGDLSRHNHHGYTYAVDLETPPQDAQGPGRVPAQPRMLVGASPELLVRRSGQRVVANPLAGSAPRSGDPATDRRRAEALLGSDKERREHAVVVEAVVEALRPYCRRLEVPPTPCIVQTDSMMHLSTQIVGSLVDTNACALTLAMALHPTPAVCGHPADRAHAAIRSLEPFERRYFTGMVGWVDARGDGEWAVSIRCAETEGRRLRLYAGAGVVAGSRAEQELAETSAKFRTMLKAMGLDHLLEAIA